MPRITPVSPTTAQSLGALLKSARDSNSTSLRPEDSADFDGLQPRLLGAGRNVDVARSCERLRRHASQTGQAFLPASEFGS